MKPCPNDATYDFTNADHRFCERNDRSISGGDAQAGQGYCSRQSHAGTPIHEFGVRESRALFLNSNVIAHRAAMSVLALSAFMLPVSVSAFGSKADVMVL